MKRRGFIKKALSGSLAVAASGVVAAPYVHASPKKYRWRLVTTFPPRLPIFQDGAHRLAKRVKEMSEGRLNIQVFAGGELVPPMGTFDAVSQGTVECGYGAAYYWGGKETACQWFTTVPFGLDAQGFNSWIYSGGGQQLWEETYAPFNLVPRLVANTGPQMGGWFNKEINTIADFKGLKMRIPGLGGKVVSKAGGTVVLLPAAEIFTSLERGVLDATEWVGPLHDLRMGFYKAAKFYYYPGWHEPSAGLEIIFNKDKYDALPKSLQLILDSAAAETNAWSLSEFDARNGAALQELVTKHKVQLKPFPQQLIDQLRPLAKETLEEEADKTKQARKVHDAFKKFQQEIGEWRAMSGKLY